MLVTNWTGTKFNDKELGYVATNHVATVVYQGEINHPTLKTVASERVTWREPEPQYNVLIITNGFNYYQPQFTNYIHGL